MAHQPKGKKGRKISRNAKKCEAYRLNRSVKNKVAKLKRHLRKHAEDGCAAFALKKIK